MIGDLIYYDSIFGPRYYGVVTRKMKKYCVVYWLDEMYSTTEHVNTLNFIMENKND